MKAEDVLTHIKNPEDIPYLRSKLLDVNMRLFKSNPAYRKLVLQAAHLIGEHSITKMEGYKLPHGTSGANLGIPWNIIAIVKNRGTKDSYYSLMINPRIVQYDGEEVSTLSNCGSIRLLDPIKVIRYERVLVEWFDVDGNFHREMFLPHNGSFTIQHEIDHNLGILITDRV